jgi:hypothetical protein
MWTAPLALPLVGLVRRPDVYAAVGIGMALVDGFNHIKTVLAAVRGRNGSVTHAVSLLGPYSALVRPRCRSARVRCSTAVEYSLRLTHSRACALPARAQLGLMVAWAVLSPTDVAYTQPYLFLLGCGFQFSLLMGRLILAHLCDERVGMRAAMYRSLVPLPFAVANAVSGACMPMLWRARAVGTMCVCAC